MAQGEATRHERTPGALSLAALAAGGGALLYAASRTKGPARAAAALGGGALIAAGLARGGGMDRIVGAAARLAPARPGVVRHAITIGAARGEVFALLRDPTRLSTLIPGVRHIEETAPDRWRWETEGPGGAILRWESVFDRIEPENGFTWYGEGDIDHCGVIELRDAPGGRGTEVVVTLSYQAPLGGAGRMAARWAAGREPGRQVVEMLRHLKMTLEVGELATVAGQPHGQRAPWRTETE